ncbi:MAG: DUF2339 domain-containing protein [Armatimonadetes bacterium]|nr:DUF2339 domain-containing protein [Armatimonadota bacterium]
MDFLLVFCVILLGLWVRSLCADRRQLIVVPAARNGFPAHRLASVAVDPWLTDSNQALTEVPAWLSCPARVPAESPGPSDGDFDSEDPLPEEQLVELPPPPSSGKDYSEKASRAEMTFAGRVLNLTGMVLFTLGVVLFFRTSASAVTSGLLPCLAAVVAGGLMLCAGHVNFVNGRKDYSHPLLAGGFSTLLLTACAAHFHYHLIPQTPMFGLMLGLVIWSGMAVFRYDSKLIGNLVLGALFLGPLFLNLPLEQVGLMTGYLLAINAGVTVVAYHKKWDYQLLVAFLGSYALYLHHFGFAHPEATLWFLSATYGLYLVANNLIHFVRESSSEYNLFLSFVNPIAYAAVSFLALVKLSTAGASTSSLLGVTFFAVTVYLVIAAAHLALAAAAASRPSSQLHDIAVTNLVMGLLFLTSSVSFLTSFITYFSTAAIIFWLTTAVWLAQACGLVECARRWPRFGLIFKRYSYFCVALASAQLLYVIPAISNSVLFFTGEGVLAHVIAVAIYLGYIVGLHRGHDTMEEKAAMTASLLVAAGLLWNVVAPTGTIGLLLASCLSVLSVVAANSLPGVAHLRLPGALVWAGLGFAALPASSPEPLAYFLTGLVLAGGAYLVRRDEVCLNLGLAGCLAALYKAVFCLGHPALLAAGGAGLSLVVFQIYLRNPIGLRWLGVVSAAGVVLPTLYGLYHGFWPASLLAGAALACASVQLARAGLPVTVPLAIGGAGLVLGSCAALGCRPETALVMGLLAFACRQTAARSCRWSFLESIAVGAESLGLLALFAGIAGGSPFWVELAAAVLFGGITRRFAVRIEAAQGACVAGAGISTVHAFALGADPGLVVAAAVTLGLAHLGVQQESDRAGLRSTSDLLAVALALAAVGMSGVGLPSYLAAALVLGAGWARDRERLVPLYAAILLVMKALFLAGSGAPSTALWALLGLSLLGAGLPIAARIVMFLSFLKSLLDANYVYGIGGLEIAKWGTAGPVEILAACVVVGSFLAAARLEAKDHEQRNFHTLMGLTVFGFQSSFLLYNSMGILYEFQAILSAFWCGFAFFFISYGIYRQAKVFRLFGLTTLAAAVLKICIVDIWVLNSYNQVGTLVILGALLMSVSFLYQKHQAILAETPEEPALAA